MANPWTPGLTFQVGHDDLVMALRDFEPHLCFASLYDPHDGYARSQRLYLREAIDRANAAPELYEALDAICNSNFRGELHEFIEWFNERFARGLAALAAAQEAVK